MLVPLYFMEPMTFALCGFPIAPGCVTSGIPPDKISMDPSVPDSPKELKQYEVDSSEVQPSTKHIIAILETVDLFNSFVTRLPVVRCWFIVASGDILRTLWARVKYPFGKASILISWHSGVMERYPGPRRPADIAKGFCKKMISQLSIQYRTRKEERKCRRADYTKTPEGWAGHVYKNPSECNNEELKSMLIGLCKIQEITVPDQWLDLIEKYKRIVGKKCNKAEKAQYAKELQSWVNQTMAEETVSPLFERLSEVSNEERNYIVRHMLEKLTSYVPELSMILQSRKLEGETVISQDETSTGHVSDSVLSIDGSDPSDTNTAKVTLQEGHTINSSEGNKQMRTPHISEIPMPSLDETGTSNPETTELADLLSDISDCVSDPLGGNVTYFMEYLTRDSQDDWSENQVRKRYAQEAGLDITPSTSKMQKSLTELELLQSSENKAANDSMDSLLNLMDFIQPEIHDISLKDNSMSNSVGDNAERGIRFDGLQGL